MIHGPASTPTESARSNVANCNGRIDIKKWATILLVLLGMAALDASAAGWADYSKSTCLPLDNHLDPLYTMELGFLPSSRLEGHGSTSMLELDARRRDLVYFRDVLAGDVDLGVIFDTTFFIDSSEVHLPNQVARIAFDLGWTWRYVDDRALQLRVKPGMYSDIEEMSSDAFFCPVSVELYVPFHADICGVLGVEVRPEFERVFFPLIGLDWALHDKVRLSLRLPESDFRVYLNKNWSVNIGYEWNNMSYALRDGDPANRKMITYEDSRYTFGVTCKMSDELQITGSLGRSFGRSVEFERSNGGSPDDIDIVSETFVRVGIGGPF